MSAITVVAGAPAARPTTRRRPLVLLAVIEGVRILRHPAFLVGAAVAAFLEWRALRLRPAIGWAGEDYFLVFVSCFPLWVGTMVAAGSGAGRGRLVHDVELFPDAPVPRSDRVLATALALLLPVTLASVGLAAIAGVVVGRDGFHHADLPYSARVLPPAVEWLQQPLLLVLAGVVGIAAVQLPRGRLGALLAVTTATLMASMAVWAAGSSWIRTFHPLMYVAREHPLPEGYRAAEWSPGDAPLLFPGEYSTTFREIRFDVAAMGWHLAYLTGLVLTVLWGAVALVGGGRRHRWLAVGVPLLLAGAVLQAVSVAAAS